MRPSVLGAGLVTVLAIALAAITPPAHADAPRSLVRIDRVDRGDAAAYAADGLDVVFETRTGVFVETGDSGIARLEARGRTVRVLDVEADLSDYVVVGVRPDSDLGAVSRYGSIVHLEENLRFVRIPRGAPIEPLLEARVFAFRAPHAGPTAFGAPPDAVASVRGIDDVGPPDPVVQDVLDQVRGEDIDGLWQDLTANPPTGTRYSTAQGCRDAAEFCRDHYVGLGLPVEFQEYSASHAPNVIATQEGAFEPGQVHIVIAHLDDLPSSGLAPGADDNASGSVAVLEAANALSCWATRSTVKYLNVTGEESGLNGSEAYADDAWARGEDIRAVFNLDMPGWAGDGIPDPENLDVNFDAASEWLGVHFADSAQRYATGLAVDAFYCPSLSASDHYPFWQKGWSAVCGITDNEGYCGHGGNYPYYHTSNDTIGNCGDPSFFHAVVRTTVAAVAELAGPFRVAFDRSAVACGGALELVVGDRDLDLDPGSVETVTVEVWSDSESTPETIVLVEDGPSSALFRGTVPTDPTTFDAGDGVVGAIAGDTIHARYVDAADCGGGIDVPHEATAGVDCADPTISGVDAVDVTSTSAAIVWTTDETASSEVSWGEAMPPSNPAAGPGDTVDHRVELTGLAPCTAYWFEVESADVAGNRTIDDNGGRGYRFETLAEGGAPCHAGRVALDAATYACSGTIGVDVTDLDLNLDPGVAEQTTVTITSDTEREPETTVLLETGPNTAVFAGSLPVGTGPALADGTVQVADGDVLTATYHDADDGSGRPAIDFDVAAVDCSGPGIRHVRLTDLTDRRATLSFETSESATAIVEWGPTAGLGESVQSTVPATEHGVAIHDLDPCAALHLRITATDETGNAAASPSASGTWTALARETPGVYWRATFEDGAPDWSFDGEWECAAPLGLGGSNGNPDPTSAYVGGLAIGTDLSGIGSYPGDYEHSVQEDAKSPTLDASGWTATVLRFERHLNVREDDRAQVVAHDRNKEFPVWDSGAAVVADGAWRTETVDLSTVVDGKRSVAIGFRMIADPQGAFFDDGVASGWNVDDVVLKDGTLPDWVACGGCGAAPSFAGAREAHDLDPCSGGGVVVRWDEAVSWGSGSSGTYAVHRGETADFEPTPSNRIGSGIAALEYVDAAAPTDRGLWYVVLAENDETCAAGPANGGVVDDNRVRVAVTESTSVAVPGEVAGVAVDRVNDAHVWLSWSPATGAATYRVYRSDDPSAIGAAVGATSRTAWQDASQAATAAPAYYRVRAVDACGREGE